MPELPPVIQMHSSTLTKRFFKADFLSSRALTDLRVARCATLFQYHIALYEEGKGLDWPEPKGLRLRTGRPSRLAQKGARHAKRSQHRAC